MKAYKPLYSQALIYNNNRIAARPTTSAMVLKRQWNLNYAPWLSRR
jgi:hypothetical protein